MKHLTAFTVAILLAGCAQSPEWAGGSGGWTMLINGTRGVENWNRVGDANWRIAEGLLLSDGGGKVPAHLVTKKSYDNFVLRVEFLAGADTSAAVLVRCQNAAVVSDKSCNAAIISSQGTGPSSVAGGLWNVLEIAADDARLSATLNGQPMAGVADSQVASGPIALQWGRGVIKFRKIEIKPI